MKRSIDAQRDGPGSSSVPDGKPIIRMFVFDDRLFLMTETSIFRAKMADEIDPERLNAAIPQVVQQEELHYGGSENLVRSTVSITAELLGNGTHLPQGFGLSAGQRLALETAQELAAIRDEIRFLNSRQKEISGGLENGTWSRAFIPQTPNLKGRAEQAIAHARQAALNIINLAELFYPKARSNLKWRPTLEAALQKNLAAEDLFLEAFAEIADHLEAMILHRNAAVHPDDTKSVRLWDYELSPQDQIVAPTIEVAHPAWPCVRTDLARYLEVRLDRLMTIYETTLSVFCDRNARQFGPIQTNVVPTDGNADSRFRWASRIREGENFLGQIAQ